MTGTVVQSLRPIKSSEGLYPQDRGVALCARRARYGSPCFRSRSFTVHTALGSVEVARERASATVRCFPGTCEIEKEYLIILSRNLWRRRGSSSRFFCGPKRETSGL